MALPHPSDFAAQWVGVCSLGEHWWCSSQSTDARRLRFYELTPARKFFLSVLLQNGVPGEIFTPGHPNHVSSPSVLESAALKVPGYPMDRNTLPFVTEMGIRHAPLPAPRGLALPSLLTPSGAHSPTTCLR